MKAKVSLLIFISLFYCFHTIKSQSPMDREYEIVLVDEIYVEVYDSTIVTKGKYTGNNECYKAGNLLVYDYYYEDINGRKFKFQPLDENREMSYDNRQKAWRF